MELLQATVNKLKADLKAGITGIKNVDEYHSQFEVNDPYENNPPEIFIECLGTELKGGLLAGGKVGAYSFKIRLYIAAVQIESVTALDFLKLVIDFLDGYLIKPPGFEATTFQVGNSELLGYLVGGAKVFKLDGEIL